MYNLYLASASTRRHEILSSLGYEFEIIRPEVNEDFDEQKTLQENLKDVVLRKALEVQSRLEDADHLILAADTVVHHPNGVLGKPGTDKEALEMLQSLMNRSHQVMTSYILLSADKKIERISSCTVHFAQLSDAELGYYIDTYKPQDKAGAYGIQEWLGMAVIDRIDGDYYTVMGLPSSLVYRDLSRGFGIYPIGYSSSSV